jgi:hypothetical protein
MGQRMRPLFFTFLRRLGRMALKVIITCLIFAVCLAVMSRYLGLPVPDPVELLDKFKDVARLGEILS